MSLNNKEILEKANAFVSAGDNEGFLTFCTDDVQWVFVGDQTISGKEALRKYMAATYAEPPRFGVENLIAEGEFVIATGKISLKNEAGKWTEYDYCDIWKFRDGKIATLKAFVIEVR